MKSIILLVCIFLAVASYSQDCHYHGRDLGLFQDIL